MRNSVALVIRRALSVVGFVALLAVGLVAFNVQPAAAALTPEECASLVAEGQQARDDLAKLIEGQGSGGATTTTTPEIASYVADLLESASINEFGFVSADAGAPLDICVPKGTTTVTLFSDPVVLWTGEATTDAYPVTVEIPAGIECGTHRMEATGPGVNESVEFVVAGSCVAAGAGAGAIDLPRTGAEIGTWVGVGAALIAFGWAVTRTRRSRSASAVPR